MQHKKYWVSAAVVALVGISTPALAAELDNGSGQTCAPGATGMWHFVNNQTDGAPEGLLDAEFSDGSVHTAVRPTKTLKNTQHFDVEAGGTLIWAETNLPGKLVLSDFTCEPAKKDDGKK